MSQKLMYLVIVVTIATMLLVAGSVQARNMFDVSYTYLEPSEGDFEDEVEQHEVRLDWIWPLLMKDDYSYDLDIGIALQMNHWEFDDARIEDYDLYKVKVPIMMGFDASDEMLINLGVTPGLHSDLEEIDGDDFRVDGSATATYLYREDLRFIFGAAFGEEFGDPEVYPILGVWWQASEDWLLNLVFPNPKISYAVSEEFRLFVAGQPAGGEWNVDVNNREFDVQQKGYRVGIGGEYQLGEGGWLYLMAGSETERELQIAEDEDEIFPDEVDLDDNAFVQIGFYLKR